MGLTQREFSILSLMSSWAICGRRKPRKNDDDSDEEEDGGDDTAEDQTEFLTTSKRFVHASVLFLNFENGTD